ncbi:MAG: TetR/AcrR family transcriptional regulator [Bacteroidota bacterium]
MDKQEEILKAALKLFVEFGFHGTPTSKIAKEAGVANGTLFHYYKTKNDLILALYTDIKTRLTEHIDSKASKNDSLKVAFKSLFINTLQWSQEYKQEFYFMQQFRVSPFILLIPHEDILRQAKAHLDIQAGIKNEILKPLPAEFLFSLINSHIYGIDQYLSSTNLSDSKQQKLIEDSFEILWDMIA